VKEIVDKTKGVWLLNGNSADVEQDLVQLLSEDGFNIDRVNIDDGNVKIIATNQVKLPKLFFLLKRPELINISLRPENSNQTCTEITYGFSRKFLLSMYLILTVIVSIMFCTIYFTFPGQMMLAIRVMMGFAGYTSFMYVLFRVLIRTHDMILFNRLKEKGYSIQILNAIVFTASARRVVIFAVSLISLAAITCVIADSLEAIITLMTILGISWFVLLIFLFPSTSRPERSPHFIVNILSAATFALYGFLPMLALTPPITTNSLITIFFCIILAIISLMVTSAAMIDLLNAASFVRNNTQLLEVHEKQSFGLRVAVIVIWLFLSIASFFSIIFSISLVEFCLFGKNYIFSIVAASDIVHGTAEIMFSATQNSYLLLRAIFILYFFPVVFMTGYIVISNLKQIFEYIRFIFNLKFLRQAEFVKALEIAEKISHDSKIIKPYLRIIEADNINAYCLLPPIPGMPNIIVLTSACKALDKESLEALIAHEMGHLKARHSFIFSVLNFASRWTLLGEGFASLLTKSSKTMELEADEFAVSWLEQNITRGRAALLELLKILEKQRIKMSMGQLPRKGLDAFPAFTVGSNAEQLIAESVNYSKKSFLKKRLFDFKMLSFFIFHGWISTYIHVPYDARVKYIQELSIRG